MKNREIRHAESTEFSARTENFVYGNKFDVVRLPVSLDEPIFLHVQRIPGQAEPSIFMPT
jgi:hypothetical protein